MLTLAIKFIASAIPDQIMGLGFMKIPIAE